MTLLQLKVVWTVMETGSISSAAAECGLSQPNASNCIKNLENEIGFEIFKRAKSGTTLTEKGRAFMEHAGRILLEQESILDIKNRNDIYRLRLGATYYQDAIIPFLKLCEKHRDDAETDFKYSSVSIKDGIRLLDIYELDILFAPILKSQVAGVTGMCKKSKLEMIRICSLPAVINLRKDHPAVLDGSCLNITQGCDLMKNYPYVSYNTLFSDSSSAAYNDSDFVQSSYKITVDEIEIRRRLVANTNAFFFGMQPSKGINEQYGTVSFPIKNVFLDVFCIIRSVDRNRTEINEYLTLLKKEIDVSSDL